jgi:Ca-activated chloride channel family protein
MAGLGRRLGSIAVVAALLTATACANADSGSGAQSSTTSMADDAFGPGGVADAGTSKGFDDGLAWEMDASAGAADYDASGKVDGGAIDGGSSDAKATTDGGAEPPVDSVQCETTKPTVLYLSADDSNSMASPTVARGLIQQGQYAYKAIRPWEFLNYASFGYPAALPGHVSPSAELAVEPGTAATFRLQLAVRAPDFNTDSRRKLNVVLAIDTSASMGWGVPGDTGLDRAKALCAGLVGQLTAGDQFALVAWGPTVQVLVDQALTSADDGKLAAVCQGLKAGGVSPFSAGLAKAYEVAQSHAAADRINRVVLVSDGGANVGKADVKLIAQSAKNAQGKDDGTGVYLMGAGVGDPWNYNDAWMDAITDAGKGAYVFLDSQAEAQKVFAQGLLQHLEVAARNVQVKLTLPPTFDIETSYVEQVSTKQEDVEPQHLAANDVMVFHQTITSCDPEALTGQELVKVEVKWQDPQTLAAKSDVFEATWAQLLAGPHALLDKGAALVAVTDALKAVQTLDGKPAQLALDKAKAKLEAGLLQLGGDADLQEWLNQIELYRLTFDQGQASAWATGGSGSAPITTACNCQATGDTETALACALDLCDPKVVLDRQVSSPTQSPIAGTFAAVAQFGSPANQLKPQIGSSYALLATGPAKGTAHSTALGGIAILDPVTQQPGVNDAITLRLHLKAPPGTHGIRFRHVFFSEEYDDYVGSSFNDKFYAILEAGSTNGGKATVINYTDCRNPSTYRDFTCSPGMQFCNPRAAYCYVAINTALSECCWLNGCPKGKAKTSIAGTGFECAASQADDGANKGSSTGWLMTEWPIEPEEEFWLTFHVHDTGDGLFDSEVILDGLQFVGTVTPGTWTIPPM